MPYKYGRRVPKNAPALEFAHFTSGTVPQHPADEDYLEPITKASGWKMLGNDVAGDCNAVTWANMRYLITSTLSTANYPSQDQVWQFYETQNPQFNPSGTAQTNGPGSGADNGMDTQTGLEYLHANGGPDGVKALAFAKVNHKKDEEVEAALAIFGGLWLGIIVLDVNPQEFDSGKPWTDVIGSGIDGRHAILGGGYWPVKFITWAQETEFEDSFWSGDVGGKPLVEEAWAVIWPENLGTKQFVEGIDLAQLKADYQDLTGKSLVLPGPAPSSPPS